MRKLYYKIPLLIISLLLITIYGYAQQSTNNDDNELKILKDKIKAAGTAKDQPGQNIVTVISQREVFIDESGYNLTVTTEITKILTENVIQNYRNIVFHYEPSSQKIEITKLRIHKKNGKTINIDTKNVIDKEAFSGSILWNWRNKIISLPAMEIEDTLEIVSEARGFQLAYLDTSKIRSLDDPDKKKYTPPLYGHYDTYELFSSHTPIMEKRLIVHTPKTKPIQFKVYNGEIACSQYFNGDYLSYTWEKKDIKPFVGEANMGMVPFRNIAVKVALSTLPDWETKSKWYYKVNEPSFKVSPEIQKKVDELTKDAKDDDEKIAILTHWCADYVRYMGFHMGEGEGYVTHPAQMTYDERTGVCKDKAGILVAFLRAAGIDAYIAMTSAMSKVVDIPADQFNHAVTAIRNKDGSFRMLDPTWVPHSPEEWSSLEEQQHIVIGTPEGQSLSKTKYFAPDENQLCLSANAKLDKDGNLVGDINMVAYGYADARIRRYLAENRKIDVDTVFYKMVNTIAPQAFLDNFTCSDYLDYKKPLKIQLFYKIDDYAIGIDNKYFSLPIASNFKVPDRLYEFLDTVSLEKRNYPVRLLTTRKLCYKSIIEIPEGFNIEKLPSKVTIDSSVASYKFKSNFKDNKITSVGIITIKKVFVEPEEYVAYKKVIDEIIKVRDFKVKMIPIKNDDKPTSNKEKDKLEKKIDDENN